MYEFVTTAFHLPADIIAWLYKARWNIEKVFDQLKNKFDGSRLGQPAIRRNPSKRSSFAWLTTCSGCLRCAGKRLSDLQQAGLQRREKGSPNTLPLPGKKGTPSQPC
ncbi:MAG: transposase [Opitutaceae bacterium]|nr:transposase [Opitutaceae bacterium]